MGLETKRKVLLVEDDNAFRVAISSFLKSKNFDVVDAENGVIAAGKFASESFDLVLSDIRMPRKTGTDLLSYVRKKSKVPFILMTGFADIMETIEAHNMGANRFVTKPFKASELFEMINSALGEVNGLKSLKNSEEKDENYCQVSISDFISTSKLKIDLFVRLGQDKFVKIAHKGSDLDPSQIEIYKKKGVEFLFIKKIEFKDYLEFNIRLSTLAASRSDILAPQRFQLLKHTEELLLRDIFVGGFDAKKFHDSTGIVKSTIEVVTEEPDVLSMLQALNTHSDFLYGHSIGVSIYSVIIGKQLGWTSMPILFKLSLGALLHDIGKKEIDRSILEKPRSRLTKDEMAILETHSFRGKEILSANPVLPSEVIAIALQHHENHLGQGPLRLKGRTIHPMANVVNVANKFCELVIKGPNRESKKPQDALQHLIMYNASELDGEALTALLSLFDYSNKEARAGA